MASSGAKRLLRVVELLASDPAALRECSLHPFGNFGIQRLLECTSRLREVLMAAGRTSALAAFARAHHGRDPFGECAWQVVLQSRTAIVLSMRSLQYTMVLHASSHHVFHNRSSPGSSCVMLDCMGIKTCK